MTKLQDAKIMSSVNSNSFIGMAARNVQRQSSLGKTMNETKSTIKTFRNLEVYQGSYQAMIEVFTHILPRLPKEEEYDLKDQLRRSSKAIPRLIAEGHSKRHQKKGFQKYLDDAMTEANETVVSLQQGKDLYSQFLDISLCERLMDAYDKIARQIFKLALAWDDFTKNERRLTIRAAAPINATRKTEDYI